MADRYTVVLSARAEKDFISIQKYTLKIHGEKQLWKYASVLKEGLAKLENNPGLSGHLRPDIPKGYRACKIGEHSLIYRMENRTVYVVAILHGSMDFPAHLRVRPKTS